MNPIIRWVGGKRRLLDSIIPLIPEYENYYEPFVGGGSVLLTQLKSKTFANDANSELINFYQQISSNHEDVLRTFKTFRNDEKLFYEIRAWDRTSDFLSRPPFERAARFLFLNKLCFQGLWRVNPKKGYNNVPYNKSKHELNVNESDIIEFSEKTKNVTFTSVDFIDAIQNVTSKDFVYFDPPYVPVSKTASFTGYTTNGFYSHTRLRDVCKDLNKMGVKFLLSNSDCEAVRNLYNEFDISVVSIERNVAAKKSSRGKITEVLIRNY